jgi:hypothetical protein
MFDRISSMSGEFVTRYEIGVELRNFLELMNNICDLS